MISDKANWTPISGSFTAEGGEKYMSIGNFRNDANTVKQFMGNGGGPNYNIAYYFIDDVYVGETPLGVGEIDKEETKTNRLYPNPNNGNMVLEYALKENETGIINIYDLTGKKINTQKLNNTVTKITFEASMLQSGVYMYEVLISNKKVKADKLVIIK